MRKIINGRRYDTDKATRVAFDEKHTGSFDDWSESLYRKNTGEFFLFGEGGPMTQYRKRMEDGSLGYGEEIIPLSLDGAKRWCEEHIAADEYEKIFGYDSEDDGSKNTVTIRLSAAAISKLNNVAAETTKTKSDIIEGLIMSAK